ncbi:MAG: hypothetical protein RLZZ303_3070 [Candidatus Hydrogenedentota bacterium]|jgi:hypothetical protein
MNRQEHPLMIAGTVILEHLIWAIIGAMAPVVAYVALAAPLRWDFSDWMIFLALRDLARALPEGAIVWGYAGWVMSLAAFGPSLWRWHKARRYAQERWQLGPRRRFRPLPDEAED